MGESLNSGGPLVTKTLVLVSQDVHTKPFEGTPEGVSGWLYAHDKETGERLGRFGFDNAPHGVPMTYMVNGKQYIVVAVGGNRVSARERREGGPTREPAQLVALALP
jgi:quinoprotein glucose dehydrogenase